MTSKWPAAHESGRLGIAPWGMLAASNHRRLPSRMLRHEFRVAKPVRRASASVSGLGFFDLYLNGQQVGDSLMNPALTGYDRRVCYVTFDVTRDIHPGENAVGVVLGNGRYFAPAGISRSRCTPTASPSSSSSFAWNMPTAPWRTSSAMSTGSSPPKGRSARTTNSMARNTTPVGRCPAGRAPDSTMRAGGARSWSNLPVERSRPRCSSPSGSRRSSEPVALTNPKPGIFLVDFGQAFYGTVRLKVSGPAGTQVRIHTSFNVTPDGLLNASNDRSALNTDVYTLKGQGAEIVVPAVQG